MKLIPIFLGLVLLASAGPTSKRNSQISSRSYPLSPHTLHLSRRQYDYALPKALNRRDDPVIDASQTKFLTTIEVNGQSFEVEIDTGSSDTWIIATNFTCEATPGGAITDESMCNFGPTLDLDSGFVEVANAHFDTCYGSTKPYRCVEGPAGMTEVVIAGITIPNQTIGAITMSSGFKPVGSIDEMSGLMGLGYPGLTGEHSGPPPASPFLEPCNTHKSYSPIVETLFNDNSVTPKLSSETFSLAISRDESNNGYGGTLAFGGLPDGAFTDPRINATDTVATTSTKLNSICGVNELSYYSIVLDGFQVGDTMYNKGQQIIIDSGATFIYAPTNTATAFNNAWEPAINQYGGVACDAVNPLPFCLVVSGVPLCINPVDLMYLASNGYCYTAIQSVSNPLAMLMGDTFLKNVIAVFGWNPDAIGFYYRPYYES